MRALLQCVRPGEPGDAGPLAGGCANPSRRSGGGGSTGRIIERLANEARDSRYSLEIRVSLDASSEEENDRIRGKGSFERALAGTAHLEKAGFLPIVTAVRFREESDPVALEEFEGLLRSRGIRKPRVKFLPVFRFGREEERSGGYGADASFVPLRYDHERLASEMRAEKIAEPFVRTIETGWWTTCLEILPARERTRGMY